MATTALLERIVELEKKENPDSLATLRDLSKLFRKEGESPYPFAPRLAFDPAALDDVSPEIRPDLAEESDAAIPIANFLDRAIRRLEFVLRDRSKDDLVIVSEGDSWFQYPFFLTDIVDHVKTKHPVRSLGGAGHLLAQMLDQDEFSAAIHTERPDAFMISGGGNDMLGRIDGVGRLSQFLKEFDGETSPEDILIDSKVQSFLGELTNAYRAIFERALAIDDRLTILCHGYAYAQPERDGPWLGGPLAGKGVPEALWPDVVRTLIDLFNAALETLASEYDGAVLHIDCRDAVGDHRGSWDDELHPKTAGFGRAAERFLAALERLPRRPRRSSAFIGGEAILFQPEPAAIARLRKDLRREPPAGTKPSPAETKPRAAVVEARRQAMTFSAPIEARDRMAVATADICGSLEAWRAALSPADFEAYDTLLRLSAAIDEPEPEERLEARVALRRATRPLDSASLERLIGDSQIQDARYLSCGALAMRAVGLVRGRHSSGQPTGAGTGFLVGDGLLITNNHVLAELESLRSEVEFDYERAADGSLAQVETFRVSRDIFVTDPELDFTLISLEPVGRRGRSISEFGRLQLLPISGKALKREPVTIIQHAGGRLKQVAIRDSYIIGRDAQHIYYTSDTEAGSSGAPVLNDDWFPVALHHRTVPDVNHPCRFVANRGIRISKICKRLEDIAGEPGHPYSSAAQAALASIFEDRASPPRPGSRGAEPPPRRHDANAPPPAPGLRGAPLASPGQKPLRVGAPGLVRSPENLVGADDRLRLPDRDPLHRAIFAFRTYSENDTLRSLGTAFAAAGRLLLTVNHNLAENLIEAVRFLDDGATADALRPIGVTDYEIARTRDVGPARELVGLRLISHSPLPSRLRIAARSAAELRGQRIRVLGYPSDSVLGPTQSACAFQTGHVADVVDGLIYYDDIDVTDGQSGGPILLEATGEVVGVHSYGFSGPRHDHLRNVNSGVHLDAEKLQEIQQWAR